MSKVIVHIDLNAFFVRAEEIKNPELEGKMVAIGHLGRAGIVSTCSYAARKFGVHSGMPMSEAKKLCPGLLIIHGDYHFYSLLSHQFIHFVTKYTKLIEVASCDECYADFTIPLKNEKDVIKYFKDFQNKLFQETKLKCSIGIGPTKFLAKMASDYKKPMGITIIRKRDIKDILYPLSIDKMFGVGKKTYPRLIANGINTIGDLALALEHNDERIQMIGKFQEVLKDWLNGEGDDEIILEREDPKSVGCSSTLDEDTDNFDVIITKFQEVCHELVFRAEKENKKGTTIQIMVKDNNYVAHNKSISFENPTSDYAFIYAQAIKLYEKSYSKMIVRAVGVTLQNLVDPKDMAIQMTLFDYQEHEEESATKLLINELNRKLKKPALVRASEVKRNGTK